jgi:hypothetical protein
MIKIVTLLIVVAVSLTAVPSYAQQVRLYVSGVETVGVQNRDEMKAMIQALLASRLSGKGLDVVESSSEADVVVSGTYSVVGKVYSVDAIAKNSSGKTLARAFVQGDKQDELIPSIGVLAEKLSTELLKDTRHEKTVTVAPPSVVAPANELSSKTSIIAAPVGEFIKPRNQVSQVAGDWVSPRLPGAANLLAFGAVLPDGTREIFLAEARRITLYRQGTEMKLVAESELSPGEQIISLDTVEGSDGVVDVFVTLIRGNEPASQVWQVKGDKLVLVAEKLPYYFRSMRRAGGPQKLYVQAAGRTDDFFGDVFEATRNGSSITLKNPLKMPRFGTIYSFNQFQDRGGKNYTAVIHPDGYVIVYDQQLSEVWRSNDKFGGTELAFKKEDVDGMRVTGDPFRWIFLNQRIQVTSRGEILVGKNDGFWVMGNSRSYKRGAVYCFVWNGSSLEEKWRTRDTQNYMPDYWLDEKRNELLMLQVVQRPGVSNRGASSLTIKKVE